MEDTTPQITLPGFGFDVIEPNPETKVLVIFIPGLAQINLPFSKDAVRQLAGKLSGGVVIPENFDVGDITGVG